MEKASGAQIYDSEPPPLWVVEKALEWAGPPGRALDLASGSGRHASLLDRSGWRVTAVDRDRNALALLEARSPNVAVVEAGLERGGYSIAPQAWDLILTTLYYQRDLYPRIRAGVRPGGLFVGVTKMTGSFAMPSQALRDEFAGWELLHYAEDVLAELIARKPDP
jgi:SAM-dependent methyltransferase